jgi:catechol 2,3-dioxygenase-like lactoylglutathione lyase family enzyme
MKVIAMIADAIDFDWIALTSAPRVLAQGRWVNSGGPVVFGHFHLYVPDFDVQRKFWADGLGGKVSGSKAIPMEAMEFQNVLVDLMKRAAPPEGAKRSSVAHLALQVPNLRAALDRLKAAGYPIVTRSVLPAGNNVHDGIGVDSAQKRSVVFVRGPDEVMVELVENRDASAISLDHIHLETPDASAMQAWYVKTFGFKAGKRGSVDTAEFPGGRLLFSATTAPLAPTKGQVVDHLGFEITNLESFCAKLPTMGITLTSPYSKFKPPALPGVEVGAAFATDPWGTYLELNEGQEQLWIN